jgi:hypothetical protein
MIRLRPVVGGLVAASALLALPAAATATGSYSVYACKGPTGAPAPAAGWNANRESDAIASNDCATGGSLAVGLSGIGPWKGGIGAEQRFTAPDATRINSLTLTRKTGGLPGAHGLAYFLNADDKILDSCDPGASKCNADLDGKLEIANLDASVLRFRAGCFESFPDECISNGGPLRVDVPQLIVGLNDGFYPTVATVGGTLSDPATPGKGTLTVTFNAGDQGGGIYRTLVNVDGKPLSATPVSGDTCADADPADTDPYEFVATVPCPTSINGLSASVDTTKLSNGNHTVEVLVEDAAGNRSPVLLPRTITVANPLPTPVTPKALNGINADTQATLKTWFDRNQKRTFSSRYGHRVVVRGTLVNRKGKGIQGARVDVYHNVGGKLKTLIKTGLKTRKDGKLTLILPLDLTTREIVLAYRANRPGPISSQQKLTLTVLSKAGNVIHQRPYPLGRKG